MYIAVNRNKMKKMKEVDCKGILNFLCKANKYYYVFVVQKFYVTPCSTHSSVNKTGYILIT